MRRLLQNPRARFRFFLRNPAYTLRSLLQEITWADERFLSTVTNCRAKEIRAFLEEPFDDAEFADHLRRTTNLVGQAAVSTADLYAKKVLILYAAARALKPQIVVETGVANGVSSSYLLLAMQKNCTGELHSIEMGDSSVILKGQPAGWVVPKQLRERWTLHIGLSEAILPGLLPSLPPVDLFIHDSLHTYEHMMLEFELAFPYLKAGGLLLADDAMWNASFPDFVRKQAVSRAKIIRGVGILQK
jgi:cephalosporin hydroxylase